jgi:hypothetical protein
MQPTRYSRMAELAGTYAQAFLAHRDRCRAAAYGLRAATADYFQAPDEAFTLVSLDENLHALEGHKGGLELIQGRDAFWYFGLALKFEGSQIGFSEAVYKVGLKCSNSEVVVRLSSDMHITNSTPEAWHAVAQRVEAELLEHYSAAPSTVRKPLGFFER